MIRIVELAARDGLQNMAAIIPTATKIALVNALSKTGVPEIEVSSFVSYASIPQLKDAEAVFAAIDRAPGVIYSGLVPNVIGLDRAMEAKADKIAVFTAASEMFNRKNINATIEESLRRFVPVIRGAKKAGLPVRGYVSTAFWCPYEGKIAPEKAVAVSRKLLDLGVDEISIGDTIGKAVPDEVSALLDLLLPHVPAEKLAMHFHDTFQQAAKNVIASYRRGITTFDSSAGGIGGCPYAPGASGNISTESLVAALRAANAQVDVNPLDGVRSLLSSPPK